MELTSSQAAQILGISETQLFRYGEAELVRYRAHGLRRRRRYDVDQLRTDAAAINLVFNEELLSQLTERSQ